MLTPDDAAVLDAYLRDIRRIPLLEASEELELGRRLAAARAARRRLAACTGGTPCPPAASATQGATTEGRPYAPIACPPDAACLSEAERAELEACLASGDAARRRLVEAHTHLVLTLAAGYTGHGLSLADLIQEGNLGLLHAADRFDYRRGGRFSTYAAWWIRHAAGRALANQASPVRVPVHLARRQRNLARAAAGLRDTLGREPAPDELAAATGAAPRQVRRALDAVPECISLDLLASLEEEGGGGPPAELVVASAEEEEVAAGELRAALRELLAALPAREQRVIELRFGLHDGEARSLAEVAECFGLTREMVRRIERQALERLRSNPRAEKLRG